MMKIPAFGEVEFTDHQENATARVIRLTNVDEASFDRYCALFEQEGYVQKEAYQIDAHRFAAYANGTDGLFLNYYGTIRELCIVEETSCLYFSYTDQEREASVAPQITQVMLEDFGMSYVIRLSDGRFVVIDGGRDFEPDAERLFECLKEGSLGQMPVIAAWIMSHPHADHFYCFITFMDRHADEVVIEKFLMNFPEADDLAHYPKLAKRDARFCGDSSAQANIPRMLERIRQTGAPIYMAHTGQRYRIGDAACEILSSMDDSIHCSDNVNATSLVIRMELGGQVILWSTDAAYSIAKIPQRYGAYLKADILQIPHHGFQSGTAEGEIEGYDWIRPKVCFLPVSDYNAYTVFCTYRKSAQYLMTNADVEEIITGTPQRTITLPYTAPAYAKKELEKKYLTGRDNGGARTWVYSELSTSREEDFGFTLLNTTNSKATVWMELFFEDSKRKVRNIKVEVPSGCLRKVCIVSEEDVDGNALYFSWLSLKEQGIPQDVPFAVRFISDIPIVVSHPIHTASYRSSLNG